MRLIPALLLCAAPAMAQTFPVGTRLTCRENGTPTGQTLTIVAPGVYADQTGARGGFVWDHRGFAFISGPHAGVPAQAAGDVLFLTPPGLGGQTLVCAPG
jgi:hypothetical protein